MPFLSVTLCQYHTLSLFVTLLCIYAQTHPGKQNQLASVRHANDRGNQRDSIVILGIPDSRYSSPSLSFMLSIVSFSSTTERRSSLTVGYSSGFSWSGGQKKAFNRRRLFSLSLFLQHLSLATEQYNKTSIHMLASDSFTFSLLHPDIYRDYRPCRFESSPSLASTLPASKPDNQILRPRSTAQTVTCYLQRHTVGNQPEHDDDDNDHTHAHAYVKQ
jgi:hypothetical protein